MRRFDDGNRHDVYKVSYAAEEDAPGDIVVRVSLSDDEAERVQAAREAKVLDAVGGRAAPVLYDFSPIGPWFDAPVMSMGFVPGRPLSLDAATPGQVERLGAVVGIVHAQPVDNLRDQLGEGVSVTSYAASRLQSVLTSMVWVREPVPASVRRRLQQAASWVEGSWDRWIDAPTFTTDERLVLLHGDIAPGNVLWGPDPVLIDWEHARLGDAADEIAYLFDQNGLTGPRRAAFWRGYRGRSDEGPTAHVIERVGWWEPATLLGSTLWWVERWVRRVEVDTTGTGDPAVPRDPRYYRDQATRRLDRLETLIRQRSPRAGVDTLPG